MNSKIPRTPLSTPLSGSARETEIRLKNIFSGPKKRPPALFLALVFAACLLCGNLVSCQAAETGEASPKRLSNSRQGDVSLDLTEHEPSSVTYKPGKDLLGEGEQQLLEALFRAAERGNGYQFQSPTAQLMNYIQKDGWVLGAVFVEDHLENTLILGIMDKESGEVPHGVFQRSYHAGVPHVATFQGDDGKFRLLYTFNGQENGQLDGQAGVVRFDGEFMSWEWPVEGDARYGHEPPGASPAAFSEYEAYWDSHLALLAPGGLDVYTVNPDFVWGGDEPMWRLDHNETFWYDSSSAEELPMPIYFQSLNWLNEYTGGPGGWRVLSLTLNEEKCDAGKQVDCYTLDAREELGDKPLTADLFFPYESEPPMRPRIYGSPSHGEIYETYQTLPGIIDSGEPGGKEKDDSWDWVDKFDEEWEKEQEAKQIAEYQSVGVAMEGKDFYYQGQLVNIFLDQRPDKSVWTLNQNPAGTVNVKILRDAGGAITGAAYLTAAEAAELAELFED